jgi:hypothetical protein
VIRIDIPQLEPYDPNRTVDQNLAILFEHERRLGAVLGDFLRSASSANSAPGELQDVPMARLAQLRVAGPPVVVRVLDEANGPTLVFNDGAVWRRCQDLAVAS